jgi:hypothetical protein
MYPFVSAGMTLTNAILDIDHDDYYAHSGQWWDVQGSAWLVHLPRRTATVSVVGPGVVSSTPEAIACPGTCSATLDNDQELQLRAAPSAGAELIGWQGACIGTGACRLAMNGDVSVRATFAPRRPRLKVVVAGRGRVASSPSGVDCPGRCVAAYAPRATVRLRAEPRTGWTLDRWSGPCLHKLTCTLVMTRDRSETATFARVVR